MKTTIASIIVAIIIIGGALLFSKSGTVPANDIPADNVSIVDGIQIVQIRAKGGYSPRRSTAIAGIPTILRVETNGTYDCSIAVRVPSLSISKNVVPTGLTDIDLGTPKAGLLNGMCGMGMYPFEIDFKAGS